MSFCGASPSSPPLPSRRRLAASQPTAAAAMPKNKDPKFAKEYQIPVEVLREGLPGLLRDAPDHEVRGGNLILIATANGLAAALDLQAPGSEALQGYIVYYLPPVEAELIAAMVESQPQAETGGAAATAPRFVIVNEQVLHAKLLALMALQGEVADITTRMEEVRTKQQPPYYIPKPPLVDHGLQAGEHLKPMKQAYFASHALAGTNGRPPSLPTSFVMVFFTVQCREFHPKNIASNSIVC